MSTSKKLNRWARRIAGGAGGKSGPVVNATVKDIGTVGRRWGKKVVELSTETLSGKLRGLRSEKRMMGEKIARPVLRSP